MEGKMQKVINTKNTYCLNRKNVKEEDKGKKVYFGTGLATLREESLRVWI